MSGLAVAACNGESDKTPQRPPLSSNNNYMAADAASAAWYAGATDPSALRDRATNRTLIAYEAWNGSSGKRVARCQVYDHAKKSFTSNTQMFESGLTDDDHGVPAIALANNGRAYAFGGAHSSNPIQVACSAAGDFSSWATLPALSPPSHVGGYCYPHPVAAGNTLYLFLRRELREQRKMIYVMRTGTIGADGTIIWDALETALVDLGTDSRVYAGRVLVRSRSGDDVVTRHSFTMSNYGDSYRQDVFSFDLDTATGTVSAVLGSFRTSALPLGLEPARANLRLTDQFERSTYTGIPAHAFDSADAFHVAYMDSAAGDTVALGSYAIRHKVLANGELTATPDPIATIQQRYDVYNLVPNASVMELWFTSADAAKVQRGGNISRAICSAHGAWSPPVKVATAGAVYPFDRPVGVEGGSPDLRVVFAEGAVPPAQGNSGGSKNITYGNLRTYGYGDAGYVSPPWQPRDETRAFAARCQTQPGAKQMQIYDGLFATLIDQDIFARCDAIWLLAAHSAQAGTLNIVRDTFNLRATGGMAFARVPGLTGSAWKGDGTSGYMESALVPTTAPSLKMTANNASILLWSLSNEQSDADDLGTLDGSTSGHIQIQCRTLAGTQSFCVNGSNGVAFSTSGTDARGLLMARRGTNVQDLYRNVSSTAIAGDWQAEAGSLPDKAITLFGTDIAFSPRQLGIASVGAGISPTRMPMIFGAFRRYLIEARVLAEEQDHGSSQFLMRLKRLVVG